MDAQADLSLRLTHIFCWFCHEVARLFFEFFQIAAVILGVPIFRTFTVIHKFYTSMVLTEKIVSLIFTCGPVKLGGQGTEDDLRAYQI